ncbi:MAG: 4Fe-4S binding protein [Spirochaetaceae bacterium]|nr:4Fe-4S binding protein [Spirochaetaceae bacterium]
MIQTLSLLIYNADIGRFKTGSVSKSQLKNVCVPGLNCYSCPGAVASCPLGALQSALAEGRPPFLVAGLLLLFGITLGRTVCGFFCPVGFFQELLYKIPSPKMKKNLFTRKLTVIKYVFLVILVILVPLAGFMIQGYGAPSFCKFVCPAGTLEAGAPLVLADEGIRKVAGALFLWKVVLFASTGVLCVFYFRAFCRFACPLGALYGFFNKYAIFGLRLNEKKCSRCEKCVKKCKMDVKTVNDRECIRCGLCVNECPSEALTHTFIKKNIKLKENL